MKNKNMIKIMVFVVVLTLLFSAFAEGALFDFLTNRDTAPALQAADTGITVDTDITPSRVAIDFANLDPECNDNIDNDADNLIDLGGCDYDNDGVLDLNFNDGDLTICAQGIQIGADPDCENAEDDRESVQTSSITVADYDDETTYDCCLCTEQVSVTVTDSTSMSFVGHDNCVAILGSQEGANYCLDELQTGWDLSICLDDEEDEDFPQVAECADRIDNDGDGDIDYPNDDCCQSVNDNNEDGNLLFYLMSADPPACNDGIDNDEDGLIDLGGCDYDNDGVLDLNFNDGDLTICAQGIQIGADPACLNPVTGVLMPYYPEDELIAGQIYEYAVANVETSTPTLGASPTIEPSSGLASTFLSIFRSR